MKLRILHVLAFSFICFTFSNAQFLQFGNLLSTFDASNHTSNSPNYAIAGYTISLSGDGKTLVVGSAIDNDYAGAVWVYTLSGGNWVQMGNKLIGSNAIGPAQMGRRVSISSDGNLIAVGGPGDNSNIGAVWLFTLTGGNWVQMGNKLIGKDSLNKSFGTSISLAGNGKTVAIGGSNTIWLFSLSGGNWVENNQKIKGINGYEIGSSVSLSFSGNRLATGAPGGKFTGATFVYEKYDSTWSIIGGPIIGTGSIGDRYNNYYTRQGNSVSLSSDGQILAVGGPGDNFNLGATWVFTNTGGSWVQMGNKLVGFNSITALNFQGESVSLSGDGLTLAVGGPGYINGNVWIYTLTGGNWQPYGNKLETSGTCTSRCNRGKGVSLSFDGKTVAIGGTKDSTAAGAAWIFNYSPLLALETSSPTHSISHFPNPFQHSLHLISETEIPYSIYNLNGILMESGVSNSEIIGEQLPAGVYLLKYLNKITKVIKTSQ